MAFQYGAVQLEWLGHASFRITSGGKVIYIDPFVLDENFPRAEMIIVTHEHYDHCAVENIQKLLKESTVVVAPQNCFTKLSFVTRDKLKLLKAEDNIDIGRIHLKTIPAYNINKFRVPGVPFHPKNFGFGVVIALDGVKIYHAGDTDFVPEMRDLALEKIDIALLPVGGTYTMTAREAVEAVRTIKPKVAVPMHWGNIVGTQEDVDLFKEMAEETCEVRIL